MRYTPHTAADQERMLHAIGLDAIDDLYRHVPKSLRERAKIHLPDGLSELAVRKRLAAFAAQNATAADWSLFLGGGIYNHFIPSAVDAVISRSEFSTSYTPYQPEVSQGTLQALFEYQTLICQLTGMEVSNAAVYDGASAAAEAVLMSRRIQPSSRRRVLLSRALHPQYRAVVRVVFEKSHRRCPRRSCLRRRRDDRPGSSGGAARRSRDVRRRRLPELLRRRRGPRAGAIRLRHRRRPTDFRHHRALVAGHAQAAGRIRRRYRRREKARVWACR